jgi:hypothetical protein
VGERNDLGRAGASGGEQQQGCIEILHPAALAAQPWRCRFGGAGGADRGEVHRRAVGGHLDRPVGRGGGVGRVATAQPLREEDGCGADRGEARAYFGGGQLRIYGSDCGADSPRREQCHDVLEAVVAVKGDGVGSVDPGVFEPAGERVRQLAELPVGQPCAAVGHSDRNPVGRAADAVLDEPDQARMAGRGLAGGHGGPPPRRIPRSLRELHQASLPIASGTAPWKVG